MRSIMRDQRDPLDHLSSATDRVKALRFVAVRRGYWVLSVTSCILFVCGQARTVMKQDATTNTTHRMTRCGMWTKTALTGGGGSLSSAAGWPRWGSVPGCSLVPI